MKRFLYVVVFFCLCFSNVAPIFAEEILPLRSSARQAYSRLVFDWKGAVQYELDQSEKGRIVLSFSRGAQIDSSKVDFSSLVNLGGMKILSPTPLKLQFSVPDDSKARVFMTSDKVFLDVYNSPTGKTVKEVKANEVKSPPPVVAQANKEAEIPAPALKTAEQKHVEEKPLPKAAIAVPPAKVMTPEIVRPEVKKNNEELEKIVDQTQHIISVTSTVGLSVSAFNNDGDLWLVMDRGGLSLRPAIQSPTPEIFGNLEMIHIDEGAAYSMKLPPALMVKSQGSDLIWRLIVAEQGKLRSNPPIYPERIAGDKKSDRGGKLLWKIPAIGKVIKMPDPLTGQPLYVVTVKDSQYSVESGMKFTDFDILPSYIGFAIRPKVDDLSVKKTADGLEITRPDGLAIKPESARDHLKQNEAPFFNPKQVHTPELPAFDKKGEKTEGHSGQQQDQHQDAGHQASGHESIEFTPEQSTLFNFSEWEVGKKDILHNNEIAILSTSKSKDKTGQIEDMMRLAKMYLSNGFGFEALGFLDFALQMQPSLKDSSEFRAMRGIARAFANKSEIALTDLLDKNLNDFDEIKLWKSYVLADLGDWKQAAEILPAKYNVIFSYPKHISNRLVLSLIEVFLRAGKIDEAEKLIAYAEKNNADLDKAGVASLEYLQGEAERQRGNFKKTIELWRGLQGNPDDLYRTKAQLALTVLQKEKGDIDAQEAINRLERLRYGWRGDQLEAQINYWLGKFYFEKKDFVKGLNIMRDATAIAIDTELGKRIALDMGEIFQSLFFDQKYKDVSALDAVTVYEQFNELTPPGERGNELVQKLAERMFEADLLERAALLLRDQVKHRLQGEEKIRVAVRLAAIELLDKRPKQALTSLSEAENELTKMPDSPSKAARMREISLLKARALSQDGQETQALQILETMEPSSDVNRLKGDIAWKKGYWSDAAAALSDVLEEENIQEGGELNEKQVGLIMNRSIALSLANDRVELANTRAKYLDQMLKSKKSRQFEIITRPHGKAELADKETLQHIISEVDLFGGFLESYKQSP